MSQLGAKFLSLKRALYCKLSATPKCTKVREYKRERRREQRKQLCYFDSRKVNIMQHGHDATVGNKLVTTSLCY